MRLCADSNSLWRLLAVWLCGGFALEARAVDLLVSDSEGDRILRFDAVSGASKGVFNMGGNLNGPDGIAVADDGDVYVTSSQGGGADRIVRFDGATGAYLGDFAELSPFDWPYGLHASADVLFATRFDAGGLRSYNLENGAFFDFQTPPEFFRPTGVTLGPDGLLYVAQWGNFGSGADAIVRFDPEEGVFVDVFADDEMRLFGPQDLAFGPDGVLYVSTDTPGPGGRYKVVRFDGVTGEYLGGLVLSESPQILFSGLEFGLHNDLYVSVINDAADSSEIRRFDLATGNLLGTFGAGLIAGGAYIALIPEPHAGLLTGFALLTLLARWRTR
jgi:sugar lactone lactonase YvrE